MVLENRARAVVARSRRYGYYDDGFSIFLARARGYISLSVVRKEVKDLFLGFRYRTRNINRVLVMRKDQAPSLGIRDFSLENEIMTHLTGDADRDDAISVTREVIGGEDTSPKLTMEKKVLNTMIEEGYIQKGTMFVSTKRVISMMEGLEKFISPTKGLVSVYRERNPEIFHQLLLDIRKAFSAQTKTDWTDGTMELG